MRFKNFGWRAVLAALMVIFMTTSPDDADAGSAADLGLDPEQTLYLELETGRVVIELHPDVAPKHVARIKELVRDGFYDGLKWHRVIGGFMAQTGDPLGNGTGGSGQDLEAEFNDKPFGRGAVGMARAADPNSGDSQFFIVYARASHLDGQYTNWGTVKHGMSHVGRLARGEPPADPDIIVKMQVAADAD